MNLSSLLYFLLAVRLSFARSDLLLRKHYFDVESDCTGPFDLLQIKATGGDCIPSKCSVDKQFGGRQQTECAGTFELDEGQVAQEFYAPTLNCTQEPVFVLVHGSSSCRNIFGKDHVFECVGDNQPQATRYTTASACANNELSAADDLEVEKCLVTDSPWDARLLGCSRKTYIPAGTDAEGVAAISTLRPRLNHLLSGSLWEEDEDHAGSAAAVSAMTWPVQLLLGVVSFLLTLAALD